MRFFLIASISFHVMLFAAWTTPVLPGHNGNPTAISLFINNDFAPPDAAHQKQSQFNKPVNSRVNNPPENTSPPASFDTATAIKSEAGNQSGAPVSTSVISGDQHDRSDHTFQSAKPVSQPAAGTQIQAYLRHAFIPYFTYPRLAQKKGWQGTVELAVNIDAQGQLTRIRIIHSSGYGVLDHAALKSIRQIKALPNAMQWLDSHGLEVNFPVKYQLIDT